MALRHQITKERILAALASPKAPATFTALHRTMGGKSGVAGSTIRAIRRVVPDIDGRLLANRPEKPAKAARRGTRKGVRRAKGGTARHPQNPYRQTSGYGVLFDLLASRPQGVPRAELVALYRKASKKAERLAKFDVAVVSSCGEGIHSERHRSARDGYGVVRDGDNLRLALPAPDDKSAT